MVELHNILVILLVGILAGWIAGLLIKGSGYGFLMNMVIGVVGAFIGGYLFTWLGIAAQGIIGLIVAAVVGALVLLVILGIIRRLAR